MPELFVLCISAQWFVKGKFFLFKRTWFSRMLRNGELLRRSEMEVYFLQEKGRLPTMDELDALVAPEGYDGRVSYSVPGGDHLNLTCWYARHVRHSAAGVLGSHP